MTNKEREERRVALIIHAADDVAVLTENAEAGDCIVVRGPSAEIEIVAASRIGAGHKVLLRSMQKGARIRKYGEVIGCLTEDASPGEHVHVHNLVSLRGPSPARLEPG